MKKHKIVLSAYGGCFCEVCGNWSNMPDGLDGEDCEGNKQEEENRQLIEDATKFNNDHLK